MESKKTRGKQAVAFIQAHGRKAWKEKAAYHQRSLSELTRCRYQAAFTAQRRAGKIENQKTEAVLKCKILNTYRRQGRPLAYKAAARL